MAFREPEVVRVVASVPEERVDRTLSTGHSPKPGDLGAVVMVYHQASGADAVYTVECVEDSGHTRWLADLLESEIESAQLGGDGAA
jgi:hypothetical protein